MDIPHIIRVPDNWMEWLTVFSSAIAVISFARYVRERNERGNQNTNVISFLQGTEVQASAMAKAGEECRFDVDKKPEVGMRGYVNDSVNGWISILEGVKKKISELNPAKKELEY